MRLSLLGFLLLLCLALPADNVFARPPSKQEIAASEERIEQTRKQLISLAKELRNGEEKLASLAEQQNTLGKKIRGTKQSIQERREEISATIKSLISLSRIPPDATVAMPENLRTTVLAAQLMTQLTKTLKTRSAELRTILNELQKDELELAESQAETKQENDRLIASRKALEQKLAERQKQYKALNKEYKAAQLRAQKAKAAARNIKQLVRKLKPSIPKTQPKAKHYTDRNFSEQKGKLPFPIVGRVSIKYGQKEGRDQTSHGISLRGGRNATVTSPASGEVMFTGPFLDYDNIIILRYDNGYHLLLAGLGTIHCAEGQKVQAGEPLGNLQNDNTAEHMLYLELRKNGKAIDPTPWFS